MYVQLYAELYYGVMLIGWMVFHLGTFITSLLGWTYNVFRPLYYPSDLTHQGAYVIVDFTTHGRSHIYGLPCPSKNSLDPMDHFCTFDVSKIIPKNMHYLLYTNFKPILMYIRGYDP